MAESTERRAAERFPVSSDVRCTFLSPVVEDFGPVKIKNVSQDGIGMVANKNVKPGQLLAVGLTNLSKSWSKTVLVRVVHVSAQPGNIFLVGGTFETQLTYDELCSMVM